MEKRHSELLANKLERVIDEGCVHVLTSELHRWYGKQRIRQATWRDLEERWQEITEGEAGQLNVVWGCGGYFLLRGDRIRPASEGEEE